MNDVYCPLPFKHAFIEPRGIKPCCSYAGEYKETIESWVRSDALKEIQQDVLNNRINHGCQGCISNEKRDGISTRLGALKDYNNEVFVNTDIDDIDYRSSNLCNFKCRSCEPFYSNGIAYDVKRNPELEVFYLNKVKGVPVIVPDGKIAPTTVSDYQWIINNIRKIKRLMLTGGEPTRIPEVRKIIDYVIEHNIQSVHILITSNASFVDDYWIEVTKKMPNIHWTLSVDAVGPHSHIIRDGSDWEIVSYNVEQMFDLSHSVNIGTVITNLNLLHLKPLFYWLNDLAKKYQHRPNGRTQFIAICNWPMRMSPYNWPSELRTIAIDYLKSIDVEKLVDDQPNVVASLIANIEQHTFNQELWNESQRFNTILDNIRNQDHQQLFIPTHGI